MCTRRIFSPRKGDPASCSKAAVICSQFHYVKNERMQTMDCSFTNPKHITGSWPRMCASHHDLSPALVWHSDRGPSSSSDSVSSWMNSRSQLSSTSPDCHPFLITLPSSLPALPHIRLQALPLGFDISHSPFTSMIPSSWLPYFLFQPFAYYSIVISLIGCWLHLFYWGKKQNN